MFSGIIADVGTITDWQADANGARAHITTRIAPLALGDSVAVNGACLTVAELNPDGFVADISTTTLAFCKPLALGDTVNLEPSLTLSSYVHGHLVSGHIDTTTRIVGITARGFSQQITLALPEEFSDMIAPRGSVTLDGVSLTVNEVADSDHASNQEATFTITLVPHTLSHTILQHWQVGSVVNVEIDMLARYIARQRAHAHNEAK